MECLLVIVAKPCWVFKVALLATIPPDSRNTSWFEVDIFVFQHFDEKHIVKRACNRQFVSFVI